MEITEYCRLAVIRLYGDLSNNNQKDSNAVGSIQKP